MALAQTLYGSFVYFAPDVIGKSIANGIFWDKWFKPILDSLTPESTFVDVGANIGFFTVYAARHCKEVWSFEASPEVFNLLKTNVEMNGLTNVHVENVPLFDKETDLTINPEWNDWPALADGKIDYGSHYNAGALALIQGKGGPYSFKSRTLDSYKIKHVDLIKVDVQGCDLKVLYGASDTITRCRPQVVFEFEPGVHNNTFTEYREFFADMNYSKVETLHLNYRKGTDYLASP